MTHTLVNHLFYVQNECAEVCDFIFDYLTSKSICTLLMCSNIRDICLKFVTLDHVFSAPELVNEK